MPVLAATLQGSPGSCIPVRSRCRPAEQARTCSFRRPTRSAGRRSDVETRCRRDTRCAHELLQARVRCEKGGNEAPPTRGTVGRVRYGGCEMRTFQGYSAIPSHMLFSGSSCNIAPLMLNASSSTSARQPAWPKLLCKAVSWVTHSHRHKQSRGRCVGRSSVDATWMRLTDPDASHVYGGVRHCSGCGVQDRLDALCRDLAANGTDGRCVGGAAVARNARTFNGFDKGEDFAWMCYPTVPPGANVALACVDGGGSMMACGMHEANEPWMAVCPSQSCMTSIAAAVVCPCPPPLAAPGSSLRSRTPASTSASARNALLGSLQPPPRSRSGCAPIDAGYPIVHASTTSSEQVRATRTDFGRLRWPGMATVRSRRQLSPAGTALSWWLRTTSSKCMGLTLSIRCSLLRRRRPEMAWRARSCLRRRLHARQQAVSPCRLLHAATTVGAPFRVAITFSEFLEPFAAASTELLTPCWWCGTITTGPTRWTTGGPRKCTQRCTQRSLASFCKTRGVGGQPGRMGVRRAAKTCTRCTTRSRRSTRAQTGGLAAPDPVEPCASARLAVGGTETAYPAVGWASELARGTPNGTPHDHVNGTMRQHCAPSP